MDHALFVRHLEPGGKLFAEFHNLGLRKRAPGDLGVERDAGDVFSNEVIEAAIAAKIESHGYIWVGDTRQTQGFVAKLAPRGIAQQTQLRQNLYGHVAVELLIVCTEYHSHEIGR